MDEGGELHAHNQCDHISTVSTGNKAETSPPHCIMKLFDISDFNSEDVAVVICAKNEQ